MQDDPNQGNNLDRAGSTSMPTPSSPSPNPPASFSRSDQLHPGFRPIPTQSSHTAQLQSTPSPAPAQVVSPSVSQTVQATPDVLLVSPTETTAPTNSPTKSQPAPTTGQSITDQLPQIEPVTWTTTEVSNQNRTKKWYTILWGVFLAMVAIDVALFAFKTVSLLSFISSLVLITAMFIAMLLSSKLPNRELTYTLAADSITINGIEHGLNEYRAFGVRQRGNLWQLVLIPTKRFGMEVVTYIDQKNGEQIVDMLAGQLAMEEIPENGIDKLIDRLKI